jgi:hypothetical protein
MSLINFIRDMYFFFANFIRDIYASQDFYSDILEYKVREGPKT